jgi:2-dehydro-3-deoxygluconokinase
MAKVLCFGELLLRMSPTADTDWLEKNEMPVYVGGAELNVATALATWGIPVAYASALPDHYLSASICSYLSQKGIDMKPVLSTGDRIGIYFLPQGRDLKHAGVIYDRAHSSFASLKPGMIDWNQAFDGVGWFHFSAISPALNDNTAAVCLEALREAAKRKITISVDLNYRASLWKDRPPVPVMEELVDYCSVVMGNIWSANSLLAIPVDSTVHEGQGRSRYLEHAAQTAIAIQKKFPLCQTVANTFRFESEGGIRYFASLYRDGHSFYSVERSSSCVVDLVGSGDCFMAGMIYGLIRQQSPAQIVDFASAAAFLKMHEQGDATNNPVEKIQSYIHPHE